MLEKLKKFRNSNLFIVILINLIIFGLVNIMFDIKYEQVDDFIIYNLYSGLDGTYNIHGIYIHPLICMLLSMLFRIIPQINWHTIFLLSMQFICFTIIGNRILKKHKNPISIIMYIVFAGVFYTTLLLLIQYTSVAALLILTAFFIIVDEFESRKESQKENREISVGKNEENTQEEKKQNKKSIILASILFAIGIMTRMQSLMIIAPFFLLYAIYNLIIWEKKKVTNQELLRLVKQYLVIGIITIIVYISNIIIYQSDDLYKEYMEYNDIRAVLHDMSYTNYEENKEIFDEIGWSKNDHYLFYTFNFGDENVYSKENLQKILDYKMSKNDYYNLNLNRKEVTDKLTDEITNINTYICLLFIVIFIVALITNKEKTSLTIFIAITTIGMNILFIVLNRSMQRVIIPEYILGTALLIYFTKLKVKKERQEEISKARNQVIALAIIIITIIFAGSRYEFNYSLEDYKQYQDIIEYTNNHKENVYLYTVPSLQYRYLSYSVYQMPPKGAFSNLRVMGGWDMFTKNYYDFKERYDLEGTFLDLLKENVYLIDGDVIWSGNYYHNYIDKIVLFIKENYNMDVQYEKIEEFDNIYVYKLHEIAE